MRYFQATQEQTYTWISWFTSSKLVGWCLFATHHTAQKCVEVIIVTSYDFVAQKFIEKQQQIQ